VTVRRKAGSGNVAFTVLKLYDSKTSDPAWSSYSLLCSTFSVQNV